MATHTRTAKARAAVLEMLHGGGEFSVRDLKARLRERGIDLEALAQRIYELRRPEYGGHNIVHRIARRLGRSVHVYRLVGVVPTAPAADMDSGAPASPSPRTRVNPGQLAWLRDRMAEEDRGVVEATEAIEHAGLADVAARLRQEDATGQPGLETPLAMAGSDGAEEDSPPSVHASSRPAPSDTDAGGGRQTQVAQEHLWWMKD